MKLIFIAAFLCSAVGLARDSGSEGEFYVGSLNYDYTIQSDVKAAKFFPHNKLQVDTILRDVPRRQAHDDLFERAHKQGFRVLSFEMTSHVHALRKFVDHSAHVVYDVSVHSTIMSAVQTPETPTKVTSADVAVFKKYQTGGIVVPSALNEQSFEFDLNQGSFPVKFAEPATADLRKMILTDRRFLPKYEIQVRFKDGDKVVESFRISDHKLKEMLGLGNVFLMFSSCGRLLNSVGQSKATLPTLP